MIWVASIMVNAAPHPRRPKMRRTSNGYRSLPPPAIYRACKTKHWEAVNAGPVVGCIQSARIIFRMVCSRS